MHAEQFFAKIKGLAWFLKIDTTFLKMNQLQNFCHFAKNASNQPIFGPMCPEWKSLKVACLMMSDVGELLHFSDWFWFLDAIPFLL